MQQFQRIQARGDMAGTPDVYYQNGRWYYWVYLPADAVFTFEADDVSRTAISPFAGLFLNMIQLAQMEQIQLELIQNPLVSLLHGEIPYRDDKNATAEDQYKLSNAGRLLFEAIWYDMLQMNNTSGIGLYAAPFENMKLESLSEAPSAMDIVKQGYSDTMSQAGMGAIIPLGDDPKAGTYNYPQICQEFKDKIIFGFRGLCSRDVCRNVYDSQPAWLQNVLPFLNNIRFAYGLSRKIRRNGIQHPT